MDGGIGKILNKQLRLNQYIEELLKEKGVMVNNTKYSAKKLL